MAINPILWMMRNREMSKVKLDVISDMYALTNTPTAIPIIPMLVSIVLVILESPLLKIPFRMLVNAIKIVNSSSITGKCSNEPRILLVSKTGLIKSVKSKLNGKNFIISSARLSFQCAAILDARIMPTMISVKVPKLSEVFKAYIKKKHTTTQPYRITGKIILYQ